MLPLIRHAYFSGSCLLRQGCRFGSYQFVQLWGTHQSPIDLLRPFSYSVREPINLYRFGLRFEFNQCSDAGSVVTKLQPVIMNL